MSDKLVFKHAPAAALFAALWLSLAATGAAAAQPTAMTPQQFSAAVAKLPAGNAVEGSNLHATRACAACHGPLGISGAPNWPHVAGQPADVTIKSLLDYRGDLRKGDASAQMMTAAAKALSDRDIADLAAHYALLPGPKADEKARPGSDAAAVAEKLVKKGDAARMVTPCAACHGTTAAGNPNGLVPILHGQAKAYLVATTKQYKDATRSSDIVKEMRFFARDLSDAEIEALAGFYASQNGAAAPAPEVAK